MEQQPSVGRIVHYIVGNDVVNALQHTDTILLRASAGMVINVSEIGDTLPLIITKVNAVEKTIEGQLFVCGNFTIYLGNVKYSEQSKPGYWTWPPRV